MNAPERPVAPSSASWTPVSRVRGSLGGVLAPEKPAQGFETIEHLERAVECDVMVCPCELPYVCGHPESWFRDCTNEAVVMALLVCEVGHRTTWAMCADCLDDAVLIPGQFLCEEDGCGPCRKVDRVVPL